MKIKSHWSALGTSTGGKWAVEMIFSISRQGAKPTETTKPWSHAFIWTRSTLATPPARRGAISDPVGNFGALHASPITFAACATIALHQHYALASVPLLAIILASFALIWARLAAAKPPNMCFQLQRISPAQASAALVNVKLPASLPQKRRGIGALLA